MSNTPDNTFNDPARFNTLYAGPTNRYPNPFFDIGQTFLPTSVKQLFHWCRYYFSVDPLINAVVYKRAEYPITDIVVDEPDAALKERWSDLIRNVLRLKVFGLEVGLDKGCYGNAYVQVMFPFKKYLKCKEKGCRQLTPVEQAKYKFVSLQFRFTCPKCGVGPQEAEVVDQNIKNVRKIKLIRWNPEYVTPEYNDITGDTTYYIELPPSMRSDITVGRKHVIETLPQVYIDAVRNSKSLKVEMDNFVHLKRPTIAQRDMGYGLPMLLPVMKSAYLKQILSKGQEVICNNHVNAFKVIFPQASGATSDPFSTYSLDNWRQKVEEELLKFRRDPGHIAVLPVPLGHELVGGEGKALALDGMFKQISDLIVAGLHTPNEFIFGGASWSGSNVSLRQLENSFLQDRESLLDLFNFILRKVAEYMEWKAPKISFKKFKMADDIQRLGLLFNANQGQKVSDETLLEEFGLELLVEEDRKRRELAKQVESQKRAQIAMAEVQGEVSLVQAHYQTIAQQNAAPPAPPQPQVPGAPDGVTFKPSDGQPEAMGGLASPISPGQQGGMDIRYIARRIATEVNKMEPQEREQAMQMLAAQNPEVHRLVLQILLQGKGSQADPSDPLQMPMPQQKPPRRTNTAAA